jgi:putative RecB family exonuclease
MFMGKTYSNSRIESFNKCKLQYKYRYIDKVPLKVETIEAFIGTKVHDALEEFYGLIKNKIVKPKEWILSKYEDLWKEDFKDSIKIVKKELSAEEYYEKGRKSLVDYYVEYAPFDQTKIVKTEESIYFNLKQGKDEYRFVGILDRLDWNDREKIFEIHDYKTSSTLMTQQEADQDLQLPLYQLALIYLLFNKQIESSRTKKQLIEVQDAVIAKIKVIEACDEFPPFKSALCDWCDFQEICPLWKHPKKVGKLEENKYRKDPGVKLVTRYSEMEEEKKILKEKISGIEQEQEKIAEAAIEFAEREDSLVIDGPDKQLVVTIKEEFGTPTRKDDQDKWEELRTFLIEKDRYADVSTVNSSMLHKKLKSWPHDVVDSVKKFLVKKVIRKVGLKNKT